MKSSPDDEAYWTERQFMLEVVKKNYADTLTSLI